MLHSIFKNATGRQLIFIILENCFDYCEMVNYKIAWIFPGDTEINERLLNLLEEAYIGTWYKGEYLITGKDVDDLIEKVRR